MADTVAQTIESCLRQNNTNFEIIAVNDGSTDYTLRILQDYAKKHECIKVINQPNKGVSAARNTGLHKAIGKYVLFLDGDDILLDNNLIYSVLQQDNNPDLIVFAWQREMAETRIRQYNSTYTTNTENYLAGKIYIHIGSIIINRLFIYAHDISFNESTYYSEDREFIVKCLLYAQEIKRLEILSVLYRYRPSSAMNEETYTHKTNTALEASERTYMLCLSEGINPILSLIWFKISIILCYRQYIRSHCKDDTLFKKLDNYSKYLKMYTPLSMNKYAIIAFFMSLLFRWKKGFILFWQVV